MKRADFQADTSGFWWGKAESMLTSRLAHLWRASSPGGLMGSRCGLASGWRTVSVADKHTPRCKRCEASK